MTDTLDVIFAALGGSAVLYGIIRAMVHRRNNKFPLPPTLYRKINQETRNEIKQIEAQHSEHYDGNRNSVAGNVLRDLERIRRERDK